MNQASILINKLLINKLLVHDTMFLQERLLTKSNFSSLKRSSVHHLFSQEAKKIRGRLSGGLAIFFRSSSKPSVIHCDDNILAIQCDSTAFINVYLPCDRRSIMRQNVKLRVYTEPALETLPGNDRWHSF